MHAFIFELIEKHDFENIFFCQEKTIGLKAIIAIAREQKVPTYRAADVLAEQHIAVVRQVKSLAI